MPKGDVITAPTAQPRTNGESSLAPLAGPTPPGVQSKPLAVKTVGGNDHKPR